MGSENNPLSVLFAYYEDFVTVHYEVFWHEYAKIPRQTKIPLPQAIWNNFGYVTENR